MLIGAASYAGLFVLLLIQALRSQTVMQPDVTNLTLFMGWAVATVGLSVAALRRTDRSAVTVGSSPP